MSLPTPIFIGDALALSNIAYQISKAFLPGTANSADGFKELHRLLRSLTGSLRLVGETFRPADESAHLEAIANATGHHENISENLSNCNELLGEFQRFIKKYSTLDQAAESSSDPSSATRRNWSTNMRRSWRKIQWAAEGDNIASLKQSLIACVSTLDLAISAANISANREMFDWLKTTLKSQEGCLDNSIATLSQKTLDLSLTSKSFSFQLFRGDQPGIGKEECLICPEATLECLTPFGDENALNTSEIVFRCICSGCSHACAIYRLLSWSSLLRLIGSGGHLVWQIWLHESSSSRAVPLIIRQLAPIYIARLEQWADRLALFQATRPENFGVTDTCISSNVHTVSLLHMKSDARKYDRRLLSVRLMTRESSKCLVLGKMSSLQILHHATGLKRSGGGLHGNVNPLQNLLPQQFVILVMYLESAVRSDGGRKYTIQVHRNTKFSVTDKPRFIAINDIYCSEEDLASSALCTPLKFSEVLFEFADSSLATSMVKDLNLATQILQVQYLTGQRWGEQLMMQGDSSNSFFIGHLVLSETKFKLIKDSESGRYRIILLRGDHTAAVCFELPPEFLESVMAKSSLAKCSRPAWFVDIDSSRIHIVRQESGVDPLSAFSKWYRPFLGPDLNELDQF